MENDAGSPMRNHYHVHVNQHHRKCGPKQTMTIKLLNGDVAFRIICHVSVIGGLIGRFGSVVSRISRETNCRIRCEDAVPGSIHQVILIIGSGSIDRRVVFRENNVIEECGEVSGIQEAVIRVFERMWELEAEIKGESDDVAYCGLLANTTQIGVVVGKGGENVTRMRRESGAKIRMLPPPICALKDDELIQITGGTLAVKKALVTVTACLQNCPPMAKHLTLLNGPIKKADYSDSINSHTRYFPRLSLGPPLNGNSQNTALPIHSSAADANTNPSPDMEGRKQKVAFRLLFSDRAASGVIGRRGAIVRSLQNATGALISFATPLTKSGERVVTISARRSVEVEGQQRFSLGVSKAASVTARLLVGAEFVGCLTGNGGRVVSEITDIIDADIQLLEGERIMDSAAQDDVLVIQISGTYKNVRNALFELTGSLRHYLSSSEVVSEARLRSPDGRVEETNPCGYNQSVSLSPESKQENILDQTGLPLTTPQQTKGRRHSTPSTDEKPGSGTLGMSLELEKTMVHLLPTEVLDEVRARSPSGGVGETACSVFQQPSRQSLDSGQQTLLMEGMAQLGLYDNVGDPSILQPSETDGNGHTNVTMDGKRGSATFVDGAELESGNKSVFLAHTTLKIVVGEHVFGSIYGEDGSNLARFGEIFCPTRKDYCHLACSLNISGAEIEVCEPCFGKSERMVVLSGAPDQTRLAQCLLQAFMEDD